MKTKSPLERSGRNREVQFASTPDGLVANGNLESMRRFLLLSGEGVQQDKARESLFQAAANGLTHDQDRLSVLRLCVYGWPVTLSVSGLREVQSTHCVGKDIVLKMRELWLRVLGAKRGVYVSPMVNVTHLNSVLGLSPLTLRDCTRRGVSLIQGVQGLRSWSFDASGPRQETGSPDEPLTFLFSAYVLWDVRLPRPVVDMGSDVALEMQQLTQAIFSAHAHENISALVGRPMVYHDAVTQGQALQMVAMERRAVSLGHSFGMEMSQDENHVHLSMGCYEASGEDVLFATQWSYPHTWRPMAHIAQIQSYAAQFSRVASGEQNYQNSGVSGFSIASTVFH